VLPRSAGLFSGNRGSDGIRIRSYSSGVGSTDKREHYLKLIAQGMNNSAACRAVGINRKTGDRWRYGRTIINSAGRALTYPPINEPARRISARFLSEDERVVIADRFLAGQSIRAIAAELGRSPSTVSREIRRNRFAGTGVYYPFDAQRKAVARCARLKAGKLTHNDELRAFVQDHLERRWSPEQISRVLRRTFPDRPEMRMSHETIYQALYVQGRGELRRELARALRTGRATANLAAARTSAPPASPTPWS
jgi:IS30 family transposase